MFYKDGQTLYLNNWDYNKALIFCEIAKIVNANGGRVKKQTTGYIENRSIQQAIIEKETRLNKLEYALATSTDNAKNDKRRTAIKSVKKDINELQTIKNDPVRVGYLDYINFVIDDKYYYLQFDDNPFFPFYYQKIQIVNGERSKDAYLEELPKTWLYDCFFRFGCSKAEIKEAAKTIYKCLIAAADSGKYTETEKIEVPNSYNSGYHIETVTKKERIEKIDF